MRSSSTLLFDEQSTVVLTTFRIIVLPAAASGKAGAYVPHRLIRRVVHDTGLMQRYSKVFLYEREEASAPIALRLSFHGKGDKEMYTQLVDTRKMRLWEHRRKLRRRKRASCSRSGTESPLADAGGAGSSAAVAASASSAGPALFSASNVGIAGLKRAVSAENKQRDEALQAAFSDIDALMGRAREMVELAERMRSQAAERERRSAAAPDGASSDGGGEEALNEYMLSLGLPAVASMSVSRSSSRPGNSVFARELAADIVKFVRPILASPRTRGIVSLTDLYCLFNRSRGSNLISPDDLLAACKVIDKLTPPADCRFAVYGSGVAVLQAQTFDETEVRARLTRMAAQASGVSAFELAEALGMSLALAREQLLAAERAGLLCRDDTVTGMRFHSNFFAQLALPA